MKRILRLVLPAVLLTAGPAFSRTDAPIAASGAERYLDQFVDRSVSPREDFFHFAVGKWLREHPIPASERSWGIYNVVQEETYRRLLDINRTAAGATGAAPGSNTQKIGDFWLSGMDSVSIAAKGLKPLQGEFDRINAVSDAKSLLATIAHLQYIGVGPLYGQYIFQDEKDSEHVVLHLYQGGLGLPDRDYYFDTDERATRLRAEYVRHVSRMFELLGDAPDRAEAEANTVMSLETELAGGSRQLEDLRDSEKNYNMMTIDGMSGLTPSIRWREMLEAANIRNIDKVVVGQPEFFRQVEKSLAGHDLDAWKSYLRWQLATTFAEDAGGDFDAEDFHFYGTILSGTPQQRPRWKRVLDQEENYLGDALGELYVTRYFGPETKVRYANLTGRIFEAFRARIEALPWMSAATKQRALTKLAAVTVKVGYPDHWRDYSSYAVDRKSYLMNCVRGNIWASDYAIAKLPKPVDRTEWTMTPQTYNAYYNSSNNEIVLPAAVFILPGIADSVVDDALVYGYAGGGTIGHEITHGFDDDGRKFDEKGNLENWWTPKDEEEFKKRTELIVRQFDAYVAVDSLHVNGKATAGENIADLGGMLLGWDAFTKTDEYGSGKSIGGFTPAQRYFIGWSLGWMNQIRPEAMAVRVKSDVHSPSFLRVNGPIANLTPFYEAYGVRPGDPMYRADDVRVRIW